MCGSLLYENGIIEEFIPSNSKYFVEQELINLFKDFKKLRSKRLYEVPNCWCLYGEKSKPNDANFNKIASDIVDENVFSPIFFIHDSEINPEWNATDSILYGTYNNFKSDLIGFIDVIAESIINENANSEENPENKKDVISLKPMGVTKDKRLLFNFSPKEQLTEFYDEKNYNIFASRIFEYLTQSFIPLKPFVIFADNKIVVTLNDEDVDIFMDKIIEPYAKNEDYDSCTFLRDVKTKWHDAVDVRDLPKTKKKLKKQVEGKVKRKYNKKSQSNNSE